MAITRGKYVLAAKLMLLNMEKMYAPYHLTFLIIKCNLVSSSTLQGEDRSLSIIKFTLISLDEVDD